MYFEIRIFIVHLQYQNKTIIYLTQIKFTIMTQLIAIISIAVIAVIYFYNRERINRVFRVKNKKAMDKIDDPMTKLEDYMEKIKSSQLILATDNKELYKAKRALEDAIKDKEKQVDDYRLKAKYNKESNPELAKKYLSNSFKYEDQISNMKERIEAFTKRQEHNKQTMEDLNFKREELLSVYQDAKRNAQFAKIGSLSNLLSNESYSELNMLIGDIESEQRAENYEHDYISEVNGTTANAYSSKVEDAFANL
ncbi:MAG: hypothetical protein RSC92_03475 [Clostridia bacterium]